jgi:hypothetical protein
MNKTVGCRVTESTYRLLQSQNKSVSDLLRRLIDEYISDLELESEFDVNGSNNAVNIDKKENRYLTIKESVDDLLRQKNPRNKNINL